MTARGARIGPASRAGTSAGGSRRALTGAALATAALVLGRVLPLETWARALEERIDDLGLFGAAIFVAAYVVAGFLLIPGSLMTLVAGAAFGLGYGVPIASIAATTTAALVFLFSRFVARERVERIARSRPKLAAVERAVGEQGWKAVLLLRLSPLVPFNVANWLFGLTPVGFWTYVAASWAGMLPGTVAVVYLGHLGGIGLRHEEKSPAEWAIVGAGLVASAITAFWTTRAARRALEHGTTRPRASGA